MGNRNILKSKTIPRWLTVGLDQHLFTSTEVANEMIKRGCKMPLTSFSQKSRISSSWGFSDIELRALKAIRKELIIKKIKQLHNILGDGTASNRKR